VTATSTTAQPLDPIDPADQAGVWPRPRLARRATALGLNATQWLYVLAGYTLWDGGHALWEEAIRSLAPAAPWGSAQGELAWAGVCLLATAGSVLSTFHGLHLYRVGQRVWRDATTPRISVWRPVDPAWEEAAAEAAEEDERAHARRRRAHRPPVADAGNPLGWVVD
jgi:hypothetical protein